MKLIICLPLMVWAGTQNITVTDCDGHQYAIPLSGSDASAIDALIREVTLASDANGFAKSIYSHMLTKLASLKDILSRGGSSNMMDLITASFAATTCPSQDDPDQVTSSSIANEPVFANGVLDDEPRGVLGGMKSFVLDSILGKQRQRRYIPPNRTFHSKQALMSAGSLFASPEKAQRLKVFQGDMIYPKNLVQFKATTPSSSTSEWTPWNLWPKGVVNWSFDAVTVDTCAAASFRTAASYFEKYTCLRFQEQASTGTSSSFSVKLTSDSESCWAYVGMSSESQVNLGGAGCQIPGIALHEIGHAIGLVHQHSRMDRDSYVTVEWGEVQDKAVPNFYKISSGGLYDSEAVSTPYDYSSVMHYGACEFSTDPSRSSGCKETLVPSDASSVPLMGQRDHLSSSDIALINSMYGCSATCGDGIQNQGETGIDCGGPCRRVCNDAKSDGIVPLPSTCADNSSRALTTKEWIILGSVIGGVCVIIALGFLIYAKRKNKRKEQAKERLLGQPANADQIRRILRQRREVVVEGGV